MGLFDTSRRRIEGLAREVLSNPTPQNMVALAESYARMQDWTQAFEVAKRAVEKFPDSEKCALTFQYVRKTQFQTQIQEINKIIRTRPQQSDYDKLARIYLEELNDRGKALEVALEGLVKFPSSDLLHWICAHIRMDRFHQDFLANDASEAIRHGQLALATNSSHVPSMLILGRLYAEAGAYDKAKPYLQGYVRMNPNEEPVRQLLALAEQRLGESTHDVDDSLVEIEARHGLTGPAAEMMALFQPKRDNSQMQINPQKMESFLRGYETMPGYKCCAVTGKDGKLVAGHTRGMVPLDKFVNLLQHITRSAENASHKMDIGSFVDGDLETSLGIVKIADWKGLVLGILADRPAKQEDFSRSMEKFQSFMS
jgi:lipopolysaccharide biosynthesis regulator YciM/predicted regulator of Ras-like GTPase activity (Roadblock/LC7/MglB family)